MRKIVVTGSEGVIGKSIMEGLWWFVDDYKIIGLDKKNGQDVQDNLELIAEADILINNAYMPVDQNALFMSWCKTNKDKNKLCVNISSQIASAEEPFEFATEQYYIDKKYMDKQSVEINKNHWKCKVSVISPNITKSNLSELNLATGPFKKWVENLYSTHEKNGTLIREESISNCVKYVIENWIEGTHISRVEVRNT